MEDEHKTNLVEWLWPSIFFLAFFWTLWHIPAFLLDFFTPESESLRVQILDWFTRKDALPNLPGLISENADIVDWIALLTLPIAFGFGIMNIRTAPMEFPHWKPWDRIALFIGRVTMMMTLAMTSVMLYEVFVRYVLEAGTKWANELTLWIAGCLYLMAGVYAMQQRCHIRITILYDVVPRVFRKIFDVLSTALIVVFTIGLIFGSYKQVFINKFYKWEMLGTAFDPPIPATIQPMILIILAMISLQAIANLIADWNLEPDAFDDGIDEDEINAIRRAVGED